MVYKCFVLMEECFVGVCEWILLVICVLVVVGGYCNVLVIVVVVEVGVFMGLIYWYFLFKVELFVEVFMVVVVYELCIFEVIVVELLLVFECLCCVIIVFVCCVLVGFGLVYVFIVELVDLEVEVECICCCWLFGDVFCCIIVDGIEDGSFFVQDIVVVVVCIVGVFIEVLVGLIVFSCDVYGDENVLVVLICGFCLCVVGV